MNDEFLALKEEIREGAKETIETMYSIVDDANTMLELREIIVENIVFFWLCMRDIFEKYRTLLASVEIYSNEDVSSGFCLVYDGAIKASGNAIVRAFDHTRVEAYDNSIIKASDAAFVMAYDNAIVEASCYVVVHAHNNATINASDCAIVLAYGDEVSVDARGSSYVRSEFGKIDCKVSQCAIYHIGRQRKMLCVSDTLRLERHKIYLEELDKIEIVRK